MTAVQRTSHLRRGEVKADDIALGEPGWPKKTTQYGNAFKNQLELPVLFYVLIAFILITSVGDVLLLALAWVFVALRVIHAYIHMTSNIVLLRGPRLRCRSPRADRDVGDLCRQNPDGNLSALE